MPIGASSAPYAKFTQPGDRHGGEIVDFRVVQTMDYDDGRPQYLQRGADGKWSVVFDAYAPDGRPNDPVCQWEITVETGVEDENGDTERRIFVDPRKGRRNTLLEGKRGGDAVAIALKKAKAHRVGLEIGGRFHLIAGPKVRDGSGPATKTWTAEYEPPPGGPGTGKPVDEMPWLIGGGRYDKSAEMAKWEATKNRTATEPAPTAEPASAGIPGTGNHASSPVLNKQAPPATRFDDDDQPPF